MTMRRAQQATEPGSQPAEYEFAGGRIFVRAKAKFRVPEGIGRLRADSLANKADLYLHIKQVNSN